MASLTTQARNAIRKAWSSAISDRRELFGLSRADLDAAIAATDDWIDTNSAAFNTALPVAARTTLTPAQKAELFMLVASKRFGG